VDAYAMMVRIQKIAAMEIYKIKALVLWFSKDQVPLQTRTNRELLQA
jgi:hypothetical protein